MAESWRLGKRTARLRRNGLLEAYGLRWLLHGAELIDDGLLRIGRVFQDRSLLAKDASQLRGVDVLHRFAARDRQLRRTTRGLTEDHVLRLHPQRAVGHVAG